VLRAWNAFYKSFDYGSALHNATKMAGDVRLNCVLTGAIADAMYGCSQYYKKLKYCHDYDMVCYLFLPKSLEEKFKKELMAIRKQREWVKVFFSKNDAMTNVERHYFMPVKNPFVDKPISKELRRRILKAFQTGWECRYGFYLDNGWICVYRSHFLLGRFQLKQITESEYRIVNLQQSDDKHSVVEGLQSALDTVERCWANEAGWSFKYLSFYYGHVQPCPDEYKGTVKEKFWYGEEIYYREIMEQAEEWIEGGKAILHERKDSSLYAKAKELGPENFGIVYFIEMLYSKWCPEDNMGWIFEY
jgi:hypothetical protein